MVQPDSLSRTFGALADPTRRAGVRLSSGALTVNEVAEPFEMTLGAVSKHLKVLESPGWLHARAKIAVASLQTGSTSDARGGDLAFGLPRRMGN